MEKPKNIIVSIVVAVGENNEIGKDNQLIWHLPADLKHFKNVTMGKSMIMGRKTFESIGRALPGRTTIIVTRQKDYLKDGCIVVNSIEEAFQKIIPGSEACIIGGAEIFKQVLPFTDIIYLTTIHQSFDADTFFPDLNWDDWSKVSEQSFGPDEKNKYSYTFSELKRK